MKKHIFFILTFLVLALPAWSQLTIEPSIGIGACIQGYIFEDGDRPSDYDLFNRPIFRPEVGFTARYAIMDSISVGAGILINGRGGKLYEQEISGGDLYEASATLSLSYLTIPLFISIGPQGGGLGAELGLLPAIAISGKARAMVNYDGDIDKESERVTFDEDILRTDLRGFVAFRYQFESLPLALGLRTELGLRNISFDLDQSVKNHAFVLYASFPISAIGKAN